MFFLNFYNTVFGNTRIFDRQIIVTDKFRFLVIVYDHPVANRFFRVFTGARSLLFDSRLKALFIDFQPFFFCQKSGQINRKTESVEQFKSILPVDNAVFDFQRIKAAQAVFEGI